MSQAAKSYPAPDKSKTYDRVVPRKRRNRGPVELFFMRVGNDLGLAEFEPWERVVVVTVLVLLFFGATCGKTGLCWHAPLIEGVLVRETGWREIVRERKSVVEQMDLSRRRAGSAGSYTRTLMRYSAKETTKYRTHPNKRKNAREVGDWVIVTPVRRGPLLNPLIEAWEKDRVTVPSDSAAATGAMPSRAPLNHFAVPQRADGRVDDIELASVSQAKHFFTRRKRPRKGAAQANAKEDAETGKSVILYLHVRLGLLTATPPLVFGGDTESFRALVHIPKRDDEDVSSTELIPLHFRTETSLPPTFPPWLSRVESLAAKEWHGSRLETVFNLPFPGSQAHGRL